MKEACHVKMQVKSRWCRYKPRIAVHQQNPGEGHGPEARRKAWSRFSLTIQKEPTLPTP